MVALTTTHKSPAPVYTSTFMQELHEAERVRKKIVLNYSVIGSVLFIGLVIEAVTWMSIAIAVIAIFVLVYTYWFGIPVSVFEKLYMHAVTNNTLNHWKGLEVDYGSHLRASEIREAGWLLQDPDYFGGKHLLYGEHQGMMLRISEVYFTTKPVSGLCNAEGVFNGLILCAQVPTLQSEPIHLHTHADMFRGEVSNFRSVLCSALLHDHTAQSNIQQLAKQMLAFSAETGLQVTCSLHQDTMQCAIALPVDFQYFRPKITTSVYKLNPVDRYERDLRFLIELAEGMKDQM